MKIIKFFHKHKETIHILASLVTIITLGVYLAIFTLELDAQRNIEFNEHISNIESLELELRKDIQGMKDFVGQKEFFINKTVHAQLVLENLKRSVADGKISNTVLKNFIITTYFDGTELNSRILYVNSPEFISLLLSNRTKYYLAIEHFRNQTIERTENEYIPSFEKTLTKVINYKDCLKDKRDIKICS